jgi:hypothetical protein
MPSIETGPLELEHATRMDLTKHKRECSSQARIAVCREANDTEGRA